MECTHNVKRVFCLYQKLFMKKRDFCTKCNTKFNLLGTEFKEGGK